MIVTRKMLVWPPLKVGLGPAMTKEDAAERLGISVNTIHGRIARTAKGTASRPFPPEDGWAFPPEGDGARLQPVPYWFERTIIAHGQEVGDLDAKGRPVVKAPAAA